MRYIEIKCARCGVGLRWDMERSGGSVIQGEHTEIVSFLIDCEHSCEEE